MKEREENIDSDLRVIAGLEAEILYMENIIAERKARIKELRASVARERAYIRARKRAESKPEHEAVRARKEAAQARLAEALEMRSRGLSVSDIAAAWGISTSRAREIVNKAQRIADFKAWKEEQNEA